MNERQAVYLFKNGNFAPAGNTIVCAAPRDLVVSVFGGGGLYESNGLSASFGGAAFFRQEETGAYYLGVWGKRNASRFRSALRRGGAVLDIVREPPPGRFLGFGKKNERPSRRDTPALIQPKS